MEAPAVWRRHRSGAPLAHLHPMRALLVAFMGSLLVAACVGHVSYTADDGGADECTFNSYTETISTETLRPAHFDDLTWSCGTHEYAAECDCTEYLVGDAGTTTAVFQILTCSVDGVAEPGVASTCCVGNDYAAWASLCDFPWGPFPAGTQYGPCLDGGTCNDGFTCSQSACE